jgi:hypothetical protein
MKIFKFGILLSIVPVIIFMLLNIHDSYLHEKIFFTPIRLDMSYSIRHPHSIPYPVPQNDGTIALKTNSELEKEKDGEGNIILSPDQVLNFEKLGSLDEPAYAFSKGSSWLHGGIKIENSPDSNKTIEVRLFSLSRVIFNYVGKYELAVNKIKFIEATCDRYRLHGWAFFGFVLLYVMLFASFILGLLLTIIGAIRRILYRPK